MDGHSGFLVLRGMVLRQILLGPPRGQWRLPAHWSLPLQTCKQFPSSFSTHMVLSWNQRFVFLVANLGKTCLGGYVTSFELRQELTGVLSQATSPNSSLSFCLPWMLQTGYPGPSASSVSQFLFPTLILSSASPSLQCTCGSGPLTIAIHHLAETPVLDLCPETSNPTSNSLCLFLPTLPLTCTVVVASGPSLTGGLWVVFLMHVFISIFL